VTATSAFGFDVIADEPTNSGMTAPNGHVVMWEQTRTLLLEDGSTAYGCLHCDYVSRKVLSIRPHLNKHRTPKTATNDQVTDLLAQLGSLSELTADRDAWKARALKAERTLRTLRTAINKLGPVSR
jgi:hypothetical protein